MRHLVLTLLSLWAVLISIAASADSAELLRVGLANTDAEFAGIDPAGQPVFRVGEDTVSLPAEKLLRWSHPPKSTASATAILTNGSRLALAASWTGERSWNLLDDGATLRTRLGGKLKLARQQLSAILLLPSSKLQSSPDLMHQLRRASLTDVLWLKNGDRLQGRLLELRATEKDTLLRFALPEIVEPLEVEETAVVALQFAQTAQSTLASTKWHVGLRDGSLLSVAALTSNGQGLGVRLCSGQELALANSEDVAYLSSNTPDCVHLSDIEDASYRHQPYLRIEWPFGRDRNVLGKSLSVAGQVYPKGLGMLTAARWSISLDASLKRYKYFAASIAVDDAALGRGSVLFRVYLLKAGQWQLAQAYPIVRGGDPPMPSRVALEGAEQLALVADFADQGDELDYANWLDARLE